MQHILNDHAAYALILVAELIKELEESENKVALDLLKKAKTTCKGTTEIGDPKVAICNEVEKLNVQLLIIGSHGRGALTRWLTNAMPRVPIVQQFLKQETKKESRQSN
ncbi:universal stress protein A-like protein [Tanacetum coccineum]|uniref:Universal stress protein A-like protein n=1 Tax=Tanacetum coccineum TaxID=301880 RepID=A0ABQ5A6C1_9ASTR